MEQSNGFNFPQTLKEKIVQYIFAGGAGLAILGGLYLLLPIIVSVLTGMVVGLKLLIVGGGLLAILFAMLTLKGPFMTAMKVLAKKVAIKFMNLMPVEHLEIIYDIHLERVRDVEEVSKIMNGRVRSYQARITEYTTQLETAEKLGKAALAHGHPDEFQAQASVAQQLEASIRECKVELHKREQATAMLKKLHAVTKSKLTELETRKRLAVDQWNDKQENAQANTALSGLIGTSSEMQMFNDVERYIRDEYTGSYNEMGAIFDQARDMISQFDLGQAAASDELLAKFSERVDRLGHDTPSFQIPTNLDVADADFVPVQSPKAAVTKFIPRQ